MRYKKENLLRAYEILRKTTPLYSDCGKLCDTACCKGDEKTGMKLFPFEEEMLKENAFYKILPSEANCGYGIIVCKGKCLREERPLACRIYPLFPFVTMNAENKAVVSVIYDPRARQNCPLATNNDVLSRRFVTAVRRAAKYLIRDKENLDYLLESSKALIEIEELKNLLL